MSNRKKPKTHAQATGASRNPHSGFASTLLQRLLQNIAGPREQERGEGRPKSMAPAGERSGTGAGSVAPYLEEARNTRPGALE